MTRAEAIEEIKVHLANNGIVDARHFGFGNTINSGDAMLLALEALGLIRFDEAKLDGKSDDLRAILGKITLGSGMGAYRVGDDGAVEIMRAIRDAGFTIITDR